MTVKATQRKIKRSFTLSPELVVFVSETRKRRHAASDSEALDLLLREKMLAMKQEEIDAAYKSYYDTVSDEVLAEKREWAEMTSRGMWADIPE
ncbi:MAG: hypothetical protein ACLQHF_06270 [Terracidiphilus sp.]